MTPLVTPQAVEILRAARERIATPERWLKGGLSTDGMNPARWDAYTCLCADGAVLGAVFEMRKAVDPSACEGGTCGAGLCLSMAAKARGYETASKFNDAIETTHADVLALLDEAAALAVSMLQEPS